ncbi:hypothetical protein NCS56_00343900 [Fusarium sp. Ph1]|nr:hypothetical protein NCS56_00343900 [Fusarium sp. Ph1]
MQEEDVDVVDSSNQLHSRDDHPWLVERTPNRLDAEQAHRPLDADFVLSFRHAISSEAARDTAFLNDATEALISTSSNMDVFYPLTLTPTSPELPSGVLPEQLLTFFRTDVYPYMSLIHHIPLESFNISQLSDYLGYAMATLSSMMIPEASSATHTLWSTAKTLITAGLEVDNREARKPGLINATNVGHGYVGTAARRLYHYEDTDRRCNAMPALILADVLRSVHYGHPLTVPTLDYLAGPAKLQASGLEIYKMTLLEGRLPPSECAQDGPLTALIAILADVHTLSHVLFPLSSRAGSITAHSTTSATSSDSYDLHNPYVPFSADNETRLLRRRIKKALSLWAMAYLPTSSPDDTVLYYFCNMYLALPSLQTLPTLAEYPPRVPFDGLIPDSQKEVSDAELRIAPEAQTCAWQILEHVQHGKHLAASWLPIAVFYASLVVWRALVLKLGNAGHSSRKVLLLFREELKKMHWPCCKTMVDTLDKLVI